MGKPTPLLYRWIRPDKWRGLSSARARSVFINCPFDEEYAPLFDAVVCATVCCGFIPRSALESGTVSETRVARIVRALVGSKYSIHDLSRCTGEGSENTARFNMPLELGMAMARRFLDPSSEHDWLVLVPEGHAYGQYVSDLSAYDPVAHDGSVPGVVASVMRWQATRPDAVPTVGRCRHDRHRNRQTDELSLRAAPLRRIVCHPASCSIGPGPRAVGSRPCVPLAPSCIAPATLRITARHAC